LLAFETSLKFPMPSLDKWIWSMRLNSWWGGDHIGGGLVFWIYQMMKLLWGTIGEDDRSSSQVIWVFPDTLDKWNVSIGWFWIGSRVLFVARSTVHPNIRSVGSATSINEPWSNAQCFF
jgi:hypothetical protein